MRRELRAVLTAMLAAVLVIDPATACHYYGYYGGYSQPCGSYCAPVSCCGGCCGYEVVHSDSCGCDGEVVYDGPSSDAAPRDRYQPSGERTMPRSGPANVQRPVDRMPRPQLPSEPSPPVAQPTQPTHTEPMATEPAPPSTPSADDLFGPPPEPAAEPTNDLFAPAETPPPTRRDTTTTEPTDDRYAPPAEEPSEPSSDDLFGPLDSGPAEAEATDQPESEPAIDDFFGPPPADTAPPSDEQPVEEEQPAAPAEEDEDDLFGGFSAILREPGGFASTALRQWVDNTGQYSCRGRLLRVLDGRVQLLKDNGRTSTVPFGRLSRSDLQFVHRQASAQRAESIGQTAQVVPLRPTH